MDDLEAIVSNVAPKTTQELKEETNGRPNSPSYANHFPNLSLSFQSSSTFLAFLALRSAIAGHLSRSLVLFCLLFTMVVVWDFLSCLVSYLTFGFFRPIGSWGSGPASGLRPVCASRAAPQARVGRNLSVPVSPTDSHLNVFRTISPINSQILPSSEVCSACDTLTKPAYNFLTRLVGWRLKQHCSVIPTDMKEFGAFQHLSFDHASSSAMGSSILARHVICRFDG
ncbi:hypothetical protein B0T09DRAFT_317097 [Sordaria sp. MPI-SDFR-AT-0083]|nr:hypothetical protein B0T09DRAFT_317097 [Sordaria sp. MPI-SDFR-AT-0083]